MNSQVIQQIRKMLERSHQPSVIVASSEAITTISTKTRQAAATTEKLLFTGAKVAATDRHEKYDDDLVIQKGVFTRHNVVKGDVSW